MRGTIAGVMTVLGFAVGVAWADMPITDVVVFSDRARIERSGEVQVGEGHTQLDLEGLPWELQETSIEVLPGVDGVRVQRVEVEPVFKRLIREEEAARLKDEVEAVKAKIHDLSAHAARLRESLAFLGSFAITPRPHDPDKAPPPVPLNPGVWMQVLDFIDGSMDGLSKELQRINRETEDASQALEVLSTKLERLSSKDVKRYRNVHVHLVSEKAGNIPVRVTYMVTGPQWFPRYELRADFSSGKVKLVAYGLVRQETGEDWKGVDMTLSTVDLAVSAHLPAMATRRISPAGVIELQPTVVTGVRTGARYEREEREQITKVRQSLEYASAREITAQQEQIRAFQFVLAEERKNLARIRGTIVHETPALAKKAEHHVKAKAALAPVQQESGQYEHRYGKIRKLYRSQQKALKGGKYEEFLSDNVGIDQVWQTLPRQGQIALSDFRQEALRNRVKAQRLIKSRKLEKDLVPPERSAAGVDYRFDSMGPANVYSEKVLTRVPYLEIAIPVEYVYESAPVLKQLFYLVATGRNPLDRPLLSGPMVIFVGPDFVGESLLRTSASGQKLRFELGVDREVEIRRQIERERDTSGFLLHSYNYKYDVTIYAINRKGYPVKVKIFDRIPYADKDAGVKVKRIDMEPKPDARYDRYGLVRWDFELASGGKEKIRVGYGLSHRTSLRVTGNEGGCSPW